MEAMVYPSRVLILAGTYPSQVRILAGTYPSRVNILAPYITNSIWANFYMVSHTNPVCLQWMFGTMIGIFEHMGLQYGVEKTVMVVCQPGPITGRHFILAYRRRMTGESDSH